MAHVSDSGTVSACLQPVGDLLLSHRPPRRAPGDPPGAGLVDNLSRPSENITVMSLMVPDASLTTRMREHNIGPSRSQQYADYSRAGYNQSIMQEGQRRGGWPLRSCGTGAARSR